MKLLKIGFNSKDNNNAEIIFERIVNLEHTMIELNDNKIVFITDNSTLTYSYDSHSLAKKSFLTLQLKLGGFLNNNEPLLSIKKELI